MTTATADPKTPESDETLLTSAEVAETFRVRPKTVRAWRKAGLINSIRTPGQHLRYRESDVRALLAGDPR